MRLPKLAIDNHQFTVILFVLLIALGIASFISMPRSEDPQVSPPGTNIIVIYPGANPKDMEELVVNKIEEELNELDDIKQIKSEMSDGVAMISIEFLVGSDSDKKHSDVIQKVNAIESDLPDQIYSLDFIKWESSDVVIIQAALVSEDAEYSEMQYEAERLESMWEKVGNVKAVNVMAFPEQEVRISIDLERMKNLNVTLSSVIRAVQSENSNIPGGSIDIGKKHFNIQTSGSYDNLEQIENTVVSSYSGKTIQLKDIADIEFGYQDIKYSARTNSKRSIFITATQKPNTNIYDVTDGLKSQLQRFEKDLPRDMNMEIVVDQSRNVTNRLTGFFVNLLQGLFLVGVIVFISVGFRPAAIVMFAIPISILMGIFLLDMSNYGIQQISIAGLVIALGLLVDNAIVVTENIDRFMSEGYKPEEAAAKGTSQIGWAISSSTVTTVLAFVPVMLIGDVTGDFIRSMPLVVIYTLFSSLLLSLTLTPYLSSKFIRPSKKKRNFVRRALDKFIDTKYRRTLQFSLKRPKLIVSLAIFVFLISLGLFPLIGVSFFPKSDRPQFMVDIELPSGTNIDETDRITRKVEKVLSQFDEIKVYASNVGKGNPRVYYNAIRKNETAYYAQVFVELNRFGEKILERVVHEVRDKLSVINGADIKVKVFEQGPPIDAPIAIRVMGENIDVLRRISLDVEQLVRNTEGVINVNNPLRTTKTDLKIKINREKAAMLGVPVFEIDKTVRAAINGLTISEFSNQNGERFDIVLRLPVNEKTKFEDLSKIYVSSMTGAHVPLSQIAAVEFESSPLAINHYNLDRNVLVTADVVSGQSVNEATQKILKKMDNFNFPKGYSYNAAGELETRQDSFGDMSKAILIAILGILAVLVLQFKSLRQPFIVFSAIPLAIIGSIIFLLITGFSFSFLAFVGLTSLVGIVVNNSIILVDYTNQLKQDGMKVIDALMKAAETRFLPIIVTTATTIGGLLPLTISGGSLWGPMGWTIIGGLTISTFLTLLVVPVLYKLFTKE
ncbi:MAG: efflux RND transporter permease subunit [Melioribacteraceae bacterium]|nr:efflux RND transporter permease subunit [Melioribacteraceae bacterium]MCF8355017.1 efflux RND transporter permease subunit [Melioribacteraceae bacterium]MCF8394342.1 efflux RND transporter permease subunit [Melioribacteraceae bacterium]MCF8420021.1 efflux RND transporter permease subunit [Melioribacteraceae bacterium]